MSAEHPCGPDEPGGHVNRLEPHGGAGDVVQARDVHGGVHFHQTLQTFAVTPQQLPGPPRGFVNRDAELAHLAKVVIDQLEAPRVVIITGTAGVGKTSVALRWAHSVRDRFPDGQLHTNLRGYDPGTPAVPNHVLAGFLRDLGVPAQAIPTGLEDRAALYRSLLAGRRILIVLDNAATVGQVRPLLPGGSECLVIVTSRSRLAGLVAREGARRLQLDLLGEEDAVALLREVMNGYRTSDGDREVAELASLCARLPLALRIAGERAASRPLMPLADLIASLRDESGLWEALQVDGDDEADAVRTVFAWSYRSLPEPAARLFRLLGLHPTNEFSAPAAAALAASSPHQIRRDLESLVGAHLVEHSGGDRYQFHDLLRAYAVDQVSFLEAEPIRATALRRLLDWYLHTTDAAQRLISPFDRHLFDEPPPPETEPAVFDGYDDALRWYRDEAANLVAAVRAAAALGEHGIAWRLGVVLRAIYMHQNTFDDWITTARLAAASAAAAGHLAGEAENLVSLGMAYRQSGALADAEACHRQALQIRREIGDRFGEALSVNALGLLALRRRRLEEAVDHFHKGEQLFAGLGEQRWVALVWGNLAEAFCERGEFESALALAQQSLVLFQQLKDHFGEGDVLLRIAWANRGLGRPADARAAIDGALDIAEQDDNDVWRAHWLAELARIDLAQGEPADALVSSQRSAVIQRRLGDRSREAIAIDLTGRAYQLLDRYEEAAKFHRRAAAVHRELGDRWQSANALANLAASLEHAGEPGEARSCRHEAATLLEEYDDPVAVALRQRLSPGH